ncbi:ead/Ea22-like family protein [Salmonella enterica subsp. enterica serovar Eastbourne]|uniref:Ead/Ea22-like family protein n=1 Tax=Salmonella enterica subsp. enterica serovar Eastbourne TaxID=486993 RepID=A0A702FDI4_SALET|nr:ead/Ea22-like family protein [Salmonella enterica subsp. enterica serovar Eastbourne]ECA1894540.1 ead/Ea22-like family protein [Salmonella enterica subsp. enterica serovar Eastbourne]HAC6677868.1 ead/Ea22-like family protein [Salmonella enterica subsp. enterica serovar Eastbourne]HAE5114950.1 ead/Ea22-like family protein [Salmonella enterica subsp. enterica serovar Eastbourne]HAE8029270.1 ead/Ea22-like family protein [Salmonella enterica subsp. enterica serovar Eastbourne]
MSEINYQALREAAERAIPAMERLLMLPADDDLLSEQELKDYGVDIDALNAFKFLTGPETVLALLDERERNQQYIKRRDQENEDIALTVGKLRVELESAKSKLNEQREYYEGVIADGSKRIAELEARAVNLPKRSVSEVMHMSGFSRDYAEGWCAGNDNAIHEIRTAGIKVKGE